MLALFAAVILLESAKFSLQCESGWSSYIHTNKCIRSFAERDTFFEALEYCEANGGTLVSIHNAFQNAQVAEVSQESDETCQYWIGLEDFDPVAGYQWTDGTSMDYQSWASGYPLPDSASTAVFMDLSDKNRWYSTGEISERKCFVCMQAPAMNATTTTLKTTPPSSTTTHYRITTTTHYQITTQFQPGCPTSWTLHEGACYFHNNTDARNFSNAELFCQSWGGHLISVHSDAEQRFMNEFVDKEQCFQWIGLQKSNGSWGWTDGSSLNYTNWYAQPPDSSFLCGTNEPSWSYWSDRDCIEHHLFVCKKLA